MSSSAVSALQGMGYTVEPSAEDGGVTVWWVSGPGVAMYVRDDDTAAWASLTNSQAASDREGQADGTIQPPGPNQA